MRNLSKKYLLHLSVLAFILVSSLALAIPVKNNRSKAGEMLSPVVEIAKKTFNIKSGDLPKNPVLKVTDVSFPHVSAKGVLAIDLDSMTPLFEKNPTLALLPASTTKIVTAMVAMDYYSDDTILTVDGIKVPGQNMGLVSGEKISFKNILEGLLIYSGNDAAEVIAENYPGGRTAFIDAMNNKAKEFNLEDTHFENPTGFDDGAHYSTAKDLIRIAIEAMKNPKFSGVVGQKVKYVASADGNIIHKLTNTNELLGNVPGVLGVKTGYTENAMENLVTYLERDGHRIMITVLGSNDRFGETKEIIDWVMSNYEWKEVSSN
jgi:serine-type D-Ala-D-Ala carboxypeptidase (penicillin-binding protein 5/6)